MTCRSSFRNYYPATIGLSSTSHGFDLNVVDIDYSKGLLGLNSASIVNLFTEWSRKKKLIVTMWDSKITEVIMDVLKNVSKDM